MLSDGEGGVYHRPPPSSGSFLVPHLPLIIEEEAREKGIMHPLTYMEDVRDEDEDEVYHRPPSSGSFLVPHLPLIEDAREKGIKHFGHQHPLTFKEDVRNGSKDVLNCNGCGIEIGRSGFSCCIEKCEGFNLHEVCASLPKEMKDHPQHPQHPLILYTYSEYGFGCNVCGAYFYPSSMPTSFHYRCNDCDFDVDLRCAFMSFLVCPPTFLHNHELTPRLYPASFLCSFCGEKHKEVGMSYQCRTCPFWIHEQCYSLPLNITHGSHDMHPLQLRRLTKGNSALKCLCGVCEEEINKQLGFYVCKRCKYYVHSKCSTKKWDPPIIEEEEEDQINDNLIQFPLPSSEVARNTLIQFIKNICQWKDDEEEEDNILIHGSHDHPLTLEFDLSMIANFSTSSRRDYEVCNGCMLPLLMNDAPFYCCNRSTCNFVLHKWCAKLPRELKHPTHTRHTLILHENLNGYLGSFECRGCRRVGNGFAYKCNECESYYLDVKCAALPRLVNYETHKHPLRLKFRRSVVGCFSCGGISGYPTYFTFGCDACNFCIHPKCLILPQEIVHWYDEHGFKLTEPDVFIREDNRGASQYHCEFCEKKINPDKLMYHCFECDQCVHAHCVRKLFQLFPNHVKVWRTLL